MSNSTDTNMQLDKATFNLKTALFHYDLALHALFIAGGSDTLIDEFTDEEITQLNNLDTKVNNTWANIYRDIDNLVRFRTRHQIRQAKDHDIDRR